MHRLLHSHFRYALVMAIAVFVIGGCSDSSVPATSLPVSPLASSESQSRNQSANSVINYDSKDLTEYGGKWANIYGPLELAAGGTRMQQKNGEFTISAIPFHVGADFSVFDHLKYIAVSTQSFPVPTTGSLEFSVRIEASTDRKSVV